MTETERLLTTTLEDLVKEQKQEREVLKKVLHDLETDLERVGKEYQVMKKENQVILERQEILDSKLDSLIELLNKKKKFLHPVQYLLVGFAISLFYLLLLSLSEHLAFGVAYLIASIATIGVITGYTRSVFRSGKITILMAGLLIAIYVFLYVALNLEDYALLVASVALFIILAIIMYISRNVDWYSITKKESN